MARKATCTLIKDKDDGCETHTLVVVDDNSKELLRIEVSEGIEPKDCTFSRELISGNTLKNILLLGYKLGSNGFTLLLNNEDRR